MHVPYAGAVSMHLQRKVQREREIETERETSRARIENIIIVNLYGLATISRLLKNIGFLCKKPY